MISNKQNAVPGERLNMLHVISQISAYLKLVRVCVCVYPFPET